MSYINSVLSSNYEWCDRFTNFVSGIVPIEECGFVYKMHFDRNRKVSIVWIIRNFRF